MLYHSALLCDVVSPCEFYSICIWSVSVFFLTILHNTMVFLYLTEKDFIGLDKSGQRVLLLSADSDVDKLTVRISHLKRSAVFTYFHKWLIVLLVLYFSKLI